MLRDLAWVVVVAIGSLVLGLAINHVSSKPLPLVYLTPEQRLDRELTSIISAPRMQVEPSQTTTLDEFRSALDNRSALILDARSSVFFQSGHVPGRSTSRAIILPITAAWRRSLTG